MSKENRKNDFALLLILLLLQLCCLYVVKYYNQDLSITKFSLLKIGNLVNLFLYFAIVAGLFVIVKMRKDVWNKKRVFTFLILSWLFLILAFLSSKIRIISSNVYIFSQPGDKVLTGLLFLFYLITLLQFLVYIWSIFFDNKTLKLGKIFIRSVIILVVFFIGVVIYIENTGYSSSKWSIAKNQNNIAVVLGAAVWSGNIPSPTLSARVDKALLLMEQGFVGKIVLTGGKAPGELPESEVAYEYARVKGADTSLISVEGLTSSTTEQIKWIKTNLSKNKSLTDIILVSDAYHLPRAIEISRFFNLNVKVSESGHKLSFEDMIYNKMRESIALFNFWNFAL